MIKIEKRERLAEGKWLYMESIAYSDADGRHRVWESVSRGNDRGAVVIVAILKPSNRLVLTRQFRVPFAAPVIEFPAGLVDAGEAAADTVLRELREETGYVGRLLAISEPSPTSAGLSDEAVQIARVEIDENAPENRSPAQASDTGEAIEVLTPSPKDLFRFLDDRQALGDRVDAKLRAFALALAFPV